MSRRERIADLQREIHELKDAGGTKTILEYANLQVEDLKDQLVGCEPEYLKLIQGRVTAYQDLIRVIEDEPHKI